MELWRKTNILGELFLEQELVFGNELIFFVCIDNEGRRFLVETLDSLDNKYLIANVDDTYILEMLKNEITMEETIRKANYAYVSNGYDNDNNLIIDEIEVKELSKDILPEVGEYYELTFKGYDLYCDLLKPNVFFKNVNYKPFSKTYTGKAVAFFGDIHKKMIATFEQIFFL